MKHKLDRGYAHIVCTNPGCIKGIWGGSVSDLSDEKINEYLQNDDCPSVNIEGNKNPTREERINHIISYAKDNIKKWEDMIKFWEENK